MKILKLAAIFLLVSLVTFAQKSAELKLNLEKNKNYKFKSTSESTITQTINGMQQVIESTSDSYMSIKAADVKPEFMVVEFHIDSVNSNTNSMGKKMLMSSTRSGNLKSSEVSDVMDCFMNRMSKTPLFLKVDYSGKVLEIINLKMYSDMVLKDFDSIALEGQMAPMIKSQIKSMVLEKTLKTTAAALFSYLPGKKVNEGDTWENVVPMSANGMELNIKNSFKLESIVANKANITGDSNIEPSSAEPMDMGGIKINYSDLKGISKATLVIDPKTGLMISSIGKTQLSGKLSVDIPGNTMEIPMDVKVDTKLEAIN